MGRRENPALTEQAQQQALSLVDFLYRNEDKSSAHQALGLPLPSHVYSSPLKRCYDFARLITKNIQKQAQKKPLNITLSEGLNEIDYGLWSGLSSLEIKNRFDSTELEAWNQHSTWPKTAQFAPSEQTMIKEVQQFVEDLIKKHANEASILAITSNGRLRYFLTLVEKEFESRSQTGTFSVKTGHLCAIELPQGENPRVLFWNQNPEHRN